MTEREKAALSISAALRKASGREQNEVLVEKRALRAAHAALFETMAYPLGGTPCSRCGYGRVPGNPACHECPAWPREIGPLTVDQLRAREGKPVWIRHKNRDYNGIWVIWSNDPLKHIHDGLDGYGLFWWAYDCEPPDEKD